MGSVNPIPTTFTAAQAAWSAAFADLVHRVLPPAPMPEQPEAEDWSITLPGLAKSPLVSSSKGETVSQVVVEKPHPVSVPVPKKSKPKKLKASVELLSVRDVEGLAVAGRPLCLDVP